MQTSAGTLLAAPTFRTRSESPQCDYAALGVRCKAAAQAEAGRDLCTERGGTRAGFERSPRGAATGGEAYQQHSRHARAVRRLIGRTSTAPCPPTAEFRR